MINITKQGNNVIVTSDNPNSFHIGNGELSVPLNTIYYVLDDESDFIQFNSTEEGNILFNGTIGQIQVNGNIVNRENILMELDNVFNSAATGGEGGTAGVLSINGYDGYINLKSINGQSLIGSGDIEISGGASAGVEAINIGEDVQDWTQKTGVVSFFTKFYDGSYDVNINGTSFYGLKPIDDSIVLENAGYTANGNFRCGVKVNEDNFKTINGESIFGTGDITIQGGGGSVTETDPVFTEWKDKTIQVIIGSGATGSDNTQFDNISIGRGARGGNRTIAIGGYSYIDSKFSTSLGTNTKSSADATYSVIIGYSASGNSENSVAIGAKAKVESGVTNGCAIGANTESNATFNTNINNVLKGDTSNYAYVLNEYGNYVKIPTEWTGTQAEYDALGTYYDNITYNIIEG